MSFHHLDFRQRLSEQALVQQFLGVSTAAAAADRIFVELTDSLPERAIVISGPEVTIQRTPGSEYRGLAVFHLFFLAASLPFLQAETYRLQLIRVVAEVYEPFITTIRSTETQQLPEDDMYAGWSLFDYTVEAQWRADE